MVDLPTPGTPVMPTRTRLPVRGSKLLHQLPRGRLMVGAPALDQRDGARDHGALAGQNSLRERGGIGVSPEGAQRHRFALDGPPRPPARRSAGAVRVRYYRSISMAYVLHVVRRARWFADW